MQLSQNTCVVNNADLVLFTESSKSEAIKPTT